MRSGPERTMVLNGQLFPGSLLGPFSPVCHQSATADTWGPHGSLGNLPLLFHIGFLLHGISPPPPPIHLALSSSCLEGLFPVSVSTLSHSLGFPKAVPSRWPPFYLRHPRVLPDS